MYDVNHFARMAKLIIDSDTDVDFLVAYDNNLAGIESLKYWLNIETWSKKEATAIMLDLIPEKIRKHDSGRLKECESFSGYYNVKVEVYEESQDGRVVHAFPVPVGEDSLGNEVYLTLAQEKLLAELHDTAVRYARCLRPLESASPAEWIKKAKSKNLFIPWLDWSIKQELVDNHGLNDTRWRQNQIEKIISVINALSYQKHDIPNGGKSEIMKICLEQHKGIFTRDGFLHAWKDGLKQNLFKMKNHDSYSKK